MSLVIAMDIEEPAAAPAACSMRVPISRGAPDTKAPNRLCHYVHCQARQGEDVDVHSGQKSGRRREGKAHRSQRKKPGSG